MGARGDHAIEFFAVLDKPAWQFRSLCYIRNLDPRIFYPEGSQRGGGKAKSEYDKARVYCEACPTKDECLQYALDHKIDDGMFGGTTPTERRNIRRHGIKVVNEGHEGRDSSGRFVSRGGKMSADERRRRQRERDRARLRRQRQRESKNLPQG